MRGTVLRWRLGVLVSRGHLCQYDITNQIKERDAPSVVAGSRVWDGGEREKDVG